MLSNYRAGRTKVCEWAVHQYSSDVACVVGKDGNDYGMVAIPWSFKQEESSDRKQHCPTVLKDETGSDRKTGRAPASHAGNWLSAWGTTQREARVFIPSTHTHTHTHTHTLTHSLPLPLPVHPSSPFRELPITTAAAPHPVSIHTQPSKPISGLRAYNCASVILCVCVKVSFR